MGKLNSAVNMEFQVACLYIVLFLKIREQKVKVLTPREAGYAIQLSSKALIDVRPSTEHEKVSLPQEFLLYFLKKNGFLPQSDNIIP